VCRGGGGGENVLRLHFVAKCADQVVEELFAVAGTGQSVFQQARLGGVAADAPGATPLVIVIEKRDGGQDDAGLRSVGVAHPNLDLLERILRGEGHHRIA